LTCWASAVKPPWAEILPQALDFNGYGVAHMEIKTAQNPNLQKVKGIRH
jgi:hypothetical protein